MLADLRLALRTLARTPGFAAAAVLCIALGIGANTAIFSVVDAVLLRPLPVRDIDRMVVVRMDLPKLELRDTPLDAPASDELVARKDLFDGAGAFQSLKYNLNVEGAEPARVGAARTIGPWFELMGARAVVGRLFGPDQSRGGQHRVVVLSYGFWQGRFGGDRRSSGKRCD
jgi:putative ABC transport system permease protein